MMPAAIELGVFSGIKLFISTNFATNKHNFVSSLLILSLLQNRSIKEHGVVFVKRVVPSISFSSSISFNILIAFLHPFVALVSVSYTHLTLPTIA